jgi:hypothetical protein
MRGVDDALLQRARAIVERHSASSGDAEILVALSSLGGAVRMRAVLRDWAHLAQCSADLIELGFAARSRTAQERAEGFAAVFQQDPELSLITRASPLV